MQSVNIKHCHTRDRNIIKHENRVASSQKSVNAVPAEGIKIVKRNSEKLCKNKITTMALFCSLCE